MVVMKDSFAGDETEPKMGQGLPGRETVDQYLRHANLE
jgi:hypothetical protein